MIRFLHPRWIALHLLVAGLAFGTIYAGRWQWQVATRHHDLRNYAYSVQWYIFLAFGLWFWVKLMRDAAARTDAAGQPRPETTPRADFTSEAPYLGYTMPQAASISLGDDPELARYNAYLTGLASSDDQPPAPAPDAGPAPVRSEGRT